MSSDKKFKSDEFNFRPRARIMQLLGEQLIKNHTLALFELIKNSYDADANEVKIELKDIDTEKGVIEVSDDGYGMDYDIVSKVWMEPANGHKGESRSKGKRTPLGRLQVGEKGVGRFAVHRLGTGIEMVTRSEGKPEVYVNIDWQKIEWHEYLDEALIDIREREAEVFKGCETGTKIKISGLKQSWKRGDVRRLYRSVLGMVSGKVDNGSKERFDVQFSITPDKKWLDGFFDPDTAKEQSMFQFDFSLTDEGLKYTYSFNPLEAIKADYPNLIENRKVTVESKYNEFFIKQPPESGSWSKRKKRSSRPLLGKDGIAIGPISGKILAFDLDRDIKDRYLKDEMSGLSEFLKEQGGVRIYRDNLRVYNYGEPGDDWLGLDHRRIQRPTGKLSNQLMLGALHLSLDQSEKLQEKTNREGFIENEAFKELQYAMLNILTEFEAERKKDKRILRDVLSVPPGYESNSLRRKKTTEELLTDLKALTIDKKLGDEVNTLVDQVSVTYKKTRDMLLSSAGTGLGLVTVFHELERGVRSLHYAISEGVGSDVLKDQSKGLVSLLQGAMYMVSKGSMEEVYASKLVAYACATQNLRFKHHKVKFINGFENLSDLDFKVKGVRRMLTAGLVNLIDNAIYWSGQTENPVIWIGPSNDLEGPAIVVSDSGPGLIDAPEDLIQPFFSRKTDGMGIGLYYVDMIMKSHSGRLSFPERSAVEVPSVCEGAIVSMVFKGV